MRLSFIDLQRPGHIYMYKKERKMKQARGRSVPVAATAEDNYKRHGGLEMLA